MLEKWKNVPPLARGRIARVEAQGSRRKGRKVGERPFYRRRAALQARNGETQRQATGEGRDVGDRGTDCQADSTGFQP